MLYTSLALYGSNVHICEDSVTKASPPTCAVWGIVAVMESATVSKIRERDVALQREQAALRAEIRSDAFKQ